MLGCSLSHVAWIDLLVNLPAMKVEQVESRQDGDNAAFEGLDLLHVDGVGLAFAEQVKSLEGAHRCLLFEKQVVVIQECFLSATLGSLILSFLT